MRPQVTECCAVAQIATCTGSATQYTSTDTGSLTSHNTSQSPVPAQQAQDSGTELYSLSVRR
jgi:hypothetical protein